MVIFWPHPPSPFADVSNIGMVPMGFLQVLVDKFLIKCQAVWVCNSWRFCRKVTSLNSWIVSICYCDGVFTFLCIFQVVLGYSLDASPELVNQAYIVNAHVLEISPRGRSFHQIYQNYLKLLLKGFFLIIAIELEWLGWEISQNEIKIY